MLSTEESNHFGHFIVLFTLINGKFPSLSSIQLCSRVLSNPFLSHLNLAHGGVRRRRGQAHPPRPPTALRQAQGL